MSWTAQTSTGLVRPLHGVSAIGYVDFNVANLELNFDVFCAGLLKDLDPFDMFVPAF